MDKTGTITLGNRMASAFHPVGGHRASVAGTISEAETVTVGLSPVYRCVLSYDAGELDLLFLGRATIAGLTAGAR